MTVKTAVILAGGSATRLGPLSEKIPKVLLPVEKTVFLELLLKFLLAQGVESLIFCLGKHALQVRTYLEGRSFSPSVKISYSIEDSPLGTGGALKLAEPKLPDEFFLLNGDTFYSGLDLEKFCEFHEAHRAAVSVALFHPQKELDFGNVLLNEKGQILSFSEKQTLSRSAWNSGGIYLIRKETLARVPEGVSSLERDIFPAWAIEGKLYGYCTHGNFYDIGTPERYQNFLDYYKMRVHGNEDLPG